MHHLPRAARRVELAARRPDEGVHPREDRRRGGREQIEDHFVARLGPQVLAVPPRSGFDLFAWLLPFAAIVCGAAAVGVGARAGSGTTTRTTRIRRRRAGAGADLELRVDQELARFEATMSEVAAGELPSRRTLAWLRSSRSRSSPA